jgi:hypothetical protein
LARFVKLLVLAVLLAGAASVAEAASITCPANVEDFTSPTTCSKVVLYPSPTVFDATLGACEPASGAAFPRGTTRVQCAATSLVPPFIFLCDFTVTVRDFTPPAITCPPDFDVTTDPGVCDATVAYGAVSASDRCGAPTIQRDTGLASGERFPAGLTVTQWRATDPSGNYDSCTFEVQVTDDEPPHLTCPDDIVRAGPGPVAYAATVEDNCEDSAAVALVPPPGSQFGVGTTRVVATATDRGGNTDECSFAVTVAPAPATTTTTTLPAGCPVAASFASVSCRLAALAPVVSANTVDPARGRLGGLLGRTGDLVGRADALAAAGRRGPTTRALRRAIARLGRFRKKVLSKKSGLAEAARDALAAEADAIAADLRTLRAS